jgi:hypothetical protein
MSTSLLVFAGSLAGIVFLVVVSFALGLGRGVRIADEAEARELADNAVCGFDAVEVALDSAGRGALLRNGEGHILLLKPHGAQFAALALDTAAPVSRDGAQLTVAGVALDLPDAGAWETRLKALDS